ncbi:hypothetical protein NUACC26_087610 [Scytonema sp. NUACC26]
MIFNTTIIIDFLGLNYPFNQLDVITVERAAALLQP